MRMFLALSIMVALVAGAAGVPANAQGAATRRDGQGPVSVAVTLVEVSKSTTRARVVLDTHSAPLDSIAFEQAVRLRRADGSEIAPAAVEAASGAGHHRQAEVVFAPVDGATTIEIVVKDVGGITSRSFRWALPLQ